MTLKKQNVYIDVLCIGGHASVQNTEHVTAVLAVVIETKGMYYRIFEKGSV